MITLKTDDSLAGRITRRGLASGRIESCRSCGAAKRELKGER